jgi:hypothetical protein
MVRDSKEFSINSLFNVKKGGHGHLGVVFASQLLRHFLTPAPPLAGLYLLSIRQTSNASGAPSGVHSMNSI